MKFVPFITILLLLFSCSNNKQKTDLAEKFIVENFDVSAALDYMVVQSNLDEATATHQLARILECSPYTIARLRKRDTYPTKNAQNKILALARDVMIDKNELEKLDPKSNIVIRSVLFFKKHYIWLSLIIITIVYLIVRHIKYVIREKCHVPIIKIRRKTVDKKILGYKIGKKTVEEEHITGYEYNSQPLIQTIAIYTIVFVCLLSWIFYRYEHRNNLEVSNKYKITYDTTWEQEP